MYNILLFCRRHVEFYNVEYLHVNSVDLPNA